MGVGGVQKLSTFSSGVVLILITLFLVLNLIHSRTGRAIMAVRDNKIAAESIGLSVTRYKLLAFVISAVFCRYGRHPLRHEFLYRHRIQIRL